MRLIIAEEDADKADIWRGVFRDMACIEVRQISPIELHSISDLDAEVIPGIFAHERYGGRPQIGVSQIISTQKPLINMPSQVSMPRWVITLPPFKAKTRFTTAAGGSQQLVIESPISRLEMLYHEFREILSTIDRFNQDYEDKISVIGFIPFLLNIEEDYRAAVETIKRAILDHQHR